MGECLVALLVLVLLLLLVRVEKCPLGASRMLARAHSSRAARAAVAMGGNCGSLATVAVCRHQRAISSLVSQREG